MAVSCGKGNEPVLAPGEMETVTGAAGMLARNLAYMPDSSGWSPPPNGALMSDLESLAKVHVELWPVFFKAAADTAAKLEQLMIQQQQEQQQEQLL